MQRGVIPEHLGRHFHVRDAAAAGVSASRLRAADLSRPFRGVAVRRDARADSLPETWEQSTIRVARQYAERMTAAEFFSHVTAAVIWGLPMPPWMRSRTLLDVSVLAPGRAPRGRGVSGHEANPRLVSVVCHRDTVLRVTSPASTWAALGSVLRHPYDLVAVGDAVVREPRRPGDRPRLATLDELTAAVAAGRRVGIGALREALPRIRPDAWSRPESWTRLLLVDAGLPEPEANVDVVDARGRRIACVDLAYVRRRVAIEYEGSQHLEDREQWMRDILRYERLVAEGWLVIRVTRSDLFDDPAHLIRRVRAALRARS